MSVRTRFAPSPTGYLHIGGVRTALFSWLYARKHQGRFILRIEDTDLERSSDASIQAILDGLQWLGIDYDEGPFKQSERFPRYQALIEQLLNEGHAYRCTCSKQRLEQLRETQTRLKQTTCYDGHCRDKNRRVSDGPHVIRFRTPTDGRIRFHDVIRGDIAVENSQLDDVIICRSDGIPTYNFTVVCDDWDMGITHVIRGDDHINNTSRQLHIINALNAPIPVYAHLPMILGSDGKRLSKRHGAVSVLHYREQGYRPEAILNYLVRLGWSHGDQEIFQLSDMMHLFDLDHVAKSGAVVNPEKLDWLNQHYLKNTPPAELDADYCWQLEQIGITTHTQQDRLAIIAALQGRCKTLAEMAQQSRYFFQDVVQYDEDNANKFLTADASALLKEATQRFLQITDWTPTTIQSVINGMLEEHSLKLPKLAQPLRVATTGSTQSPSIDRTLSLIGKQRVLERLERAINWIDK